MIFLEFVKWYFFDTPLIMFKIWWNFFRFFFDFFGVRYHFKTLFRPWHAMVVTYEGASRIQQFFFKVFSRVIGSIIGAIVRSITIILGITIALTSLIFLPLAEGFWLLLPFLLLFLFITGMTNFFP